MGSSPNRGQSPVEWGEIPSICPYVCTSICPPSGWPSDPAGWPPDPAGWPSDPSSWPSHPSSQPSEHSSHPSEHSSQPPGSKGQLEGSKNLLKGSRGQPAGSESQPAGSEGQPVGGWTDRQTNGRMDGQVEFLPILQDFVPLSGLLHCYPLRFYHIKEAGKGYH